MRRFLSVPHFLWLSVESVLCTIVTFTTGSIIFCSCDKAMPAAFWSSYKDDLIKENISDQGPWGGHRSIYWESKRDGEFNIKAVIDYTSNSGWTLVDKTGFSRKEVEQWTSDGAKIFALDPEGHAAGHGMSTIYQTFPRWISDNLEVLKFNSGWLIVKADTDESMIAYGYVLINRRGNKMTVYHFWGEY
jgi:hypothetical protein